MLPHVPDAWVDATKTKVGYEIPFTRHFYKYQPPRTLEEIDADLEARIARVLDLLREVEAVSRAGVPASLDRWLDRDPVAGAIVRSRPRQRVTECSDVADGQAAVRLCDHGDVLGTSRA